MISCLCEQDVSTVHAWAVLVAATITHGLAARGALGEVHPGPGQELNLSRTYVVSAARGMSRPSGGPCQPLAETTSLSLLRSFE